MHRHRLRSALVLVLPVCAAVAATIAAPGTAARSAAPGPWCGGPSWKLATLNDADRKKVVRTAKDTSIPSIAALAAPKKIGATRSTAFQRQVWRLTVVVQDVRIGRDGEIGLVLYDIPSGTYMNAYLANPKCFTAKTPLRKSMAAARSELLTRCGPAHPAWTPLGASARIEGVGYWNPLTVTRGALKNGAELRPITSFTITSGCGVG